jgi:hypothetical protein
MVELRILGVHKQVTFVFNLQKVVSNVTQPPASQACITARLA